MVRLIMALALVAGMTTGAWAAGPVDEVPQAPVDRPAQASAAGGMDVIETSDGRTHRGRILSELQQGFLFREEEGITQVIPYAQVTEIQRAAELLHPPAPVVPPAPVAAPVAAPSTMEQAARVLVSPGYAARRRSVPLAYVLELLVPGAGHMYAGAIGEGMTHLLLVTLLPGVILGGLLAGGVTLYALNPDLGVTQVVTGLLINFLIILVAAVLSARVASVMRAGPAATTYNTRLLGEMMQEGLVAPGDGD